jgi:aryl-alcohol dehydrogenase-like predicted oxidoreductase
LGTVQFGMNYGVANKTGKPSIKAVGAILDIARRNGVAMIDTAAGYGDSEVVLGKLGVSEFDVVTKLPEIPTNVKSIAEWVYGMTAQSLDKLKISSLYAVLLHRPEQMVGPSGDKIFRALRTLKDQGLATKIGISAYEPAELSLLAQRYSLDLVQVPVNIVDRRLIRSGLLRTLKNAGVEVIARSVFLQGLLLMRHDELPKEFEGWNGLFASWYRWLEKNNVTAQAACLQFLLQQEGIDRVVVGVDTPDQLLDLVSASNTPIHLSLPDIACDDVRLINPVHWVKK